MTKLYSYIVLLFWASLSMIFSLFLFTNGFFLRRNAILTRNDCTSFSTNINILDFKYPTSIAKQCLESQIRVVLLVVDALKYEFVETYPMDETSYHRNKLPVINQILQKYPKKSKLLKFIADPPTTTMQRLKSITTGTLPTFIDAHDNFAADSIAEDNFVDLNKDNGNIFMGDDTWTKLYPKKFVREYSAPSFDVSDLDTVDSEVRKRIFKEIKNTDWSLLIAHTLGVDHCGHKHGMHHPEMSRKLNETNVLIEKLIENINENEKDTILFVVGDHGMTESGDHGGDSLDEIEAAMFIYATVPLIDTSSGLDIAKKSIVNQIDIVPTISHILGNPVPFSNIGHIIIEALPSKQAIKNVKMSDFYYILYALWANVFQVQNYINAYSAGNSFSDADMLTELKNKYEELMEKISVVKDESDLKHFVKVADEYFTIVRRICYEAWVQFEPNIMMRGLVLFFCASFSFFIILSGITGKRMYTVFDSSFLYFLNAVSFIGVIMILLFFWLQIIVDFTNILLFFGGLVPVLCFTMLIIQNWDCIAMTWFEKSHQKKSMTDILSRVIMVVMVFGVFSNSYIVEENRVLSYFLITMFCFLIFYSTRHPPEDRKGKSFGKPNKKMSYISIPVILVFVICLLIRITNYFWRYREEQIKSDDYMGLVIGKTGSIISQDVELIFIVTAIASLALYVSVIKIWLRDCGNLSGFSSSEILARYAPGIMVVAISCYWILKLQRYAKLNTVLLHKVNSLALFVYMLFLIALLLIFYRPLTVFLMPKEKECISIYQEETSVPKLFKKMKNILYKKKKEDEDEVPIVFGLGTVYSSCYILLSVFLCLVYMLLLGFTLAPSVILMNTICIGLLCICGVDRISSASKLEELLRVSDHSILCWFLIAEYFFYATGHQPSFPTIQWEAGFVGIDGSLQMNSIRAVLIGLNTFGSYAILGVTLPLIAIAPFTIRLVYPNLAIFTKVQWEDVKKGELVLFQNDKLFHSEVFSVAGKYILFHAVRVFACMLAATVHRRHLMVWKIFAPKLIFEGISFIVTCFGVLISLLLLGRIENRMEKLISKIT